MNTVLTRLSSLIRQIMPEENKAIEINESSHFVDDLAFDSLRSIMLSTLIESEFELSLEMKMDEMMKVQTVADICAFIEREAAVEAG
jgi:acyl carrier protein